jgi:hypothetical protein
LRLFFRPIIAFSHSFALFRSPSDGGRPSIGLVFTDRVLSIFGSRLGAVPISPSAPRTFYWAILKNWPTWTCRTRPTFPITPSLVVLARPLPGRQSGQVIPVWHGNRQPWVTDWFRSGILCLLSVDRCSIMQLGKTIRMPHTSTRSGARDCHHRPGPFHVSLQRAGAAVNHRLVAALSLNWFPLMDSNHDLLSQIQPSCR